VIAILLIAQVNETFILQMFR